MTKMTFVAAGLCLTLHAQPQSARKFELKAESPQFWKLIGRQAKLQKVAGDFGFTEGPVWDSRGFLYVSDEVKNWIYRLYPDGRREPFFQTVDPDGSTFGPDLELVTTASALRAVVAVREGGSYRVLADKYEGKRFNSPNDVVMGPDGAIYFTDPTLDLPKGQPQELAFQGVYRLGADGSVRLLIRDLTQPNGLAFSPDGKRLYVDDSEKRDIRVYDVGPGGDVQNGRLFGREDGPADAGVPDGMRVDLKGNLFVTGPLGIWVWDPQGTHLGTIVVPEQPANLAWGETNYGTLFITATTSVYRLVTGTRGFVPYLTNRAK